MNQKRKIQMLKIIATISMICIICSIMDMSENYSSSFDRGVAAGKSFGLGLKLVSIIGLIIYIKNIDRNQEAKL